MAGLRKAGGGNKKKEGGDTCGNKEKGEEDEGQGKEAAALVGGSGRMGRAGGFGPCILIGKEMTHVRSKMEPR